MNVGGDFYYARTFEDYSVINEAMVGGTTCERPSNGFLAKYVSKIWKMLEKAAEKTVNVTTKRCVRTEEPTLKKNCSSKDMMLMFKRLDSYFFMDSFYQTKKKGLKSARDNTCCQLFVADEGHTCVVSMRK